MAAGSVSRRYARALFSMGVDRGTFEQLGKELDAFADLWTGSAELAFSPYETVSSILPGYTRNPYALDRVTAGSSGGTGAAVAAQHVGYSRTAARTLSLGQSLRAPPGASAQC